jgi:hypothetical protein
MNKIIKMQFLAIAIFSAHAQSSVLMRCDGYIEQISDIRQEKKPASITIDLSLAEKTVVIEGLWGCFADFNSDLGAKSKCTSILPVSINDSAVLYSVESDGENYNSFTMLNLYRTSGRFSAFSRATAKPASGARWKTMVITTEMQCAITKKMF